MSLRLAVPKLATLPGRLWARLTKHWWVEPRQEFERRWQRLMLNGPIGGLVGLIFGILAAGRWDLPILLFPAMSGLAGLYLMYLAGHMESFIRTRAISPAGRTAVLVAVGMDLVVGAILGRAMAFVLGADSAAALGGGAATLAAYSYVSSQLLWGDWIDRLVRLFTGHLGASPSVDYSHQLDLEARGLIDEALKSYEKVSEERGGHPGPLIEAAVMLRNQKRSEEAVAWYRRALALPKVDARRASIFVQNIQEICAVDLEDACLAMPDIETLLERYRENPEVAWAHLALDTLRDVQALPAELQGGEGTLAEEDTHVRRDPPEDEQTPEGEQTPGEDPP